MKNLLSFTFILFFTFQISAQILPEPIATSDELNKAKAIYLAVPKYPAAAKAIRAGGQVNVKVKIDKNGNVISAQAETGHPLLRGAAEAAAMESKFVPTTINGKAIEVTGTIVFNFSKYEEKNTWESVGENLMANLNGRRPAGKTPSENTYLGGIGRRIQRIQFTQRCGRRRITTKTNGDSNKFIAVKA